MVYYLIYTVQYDSITIYHTKNHTHRWYWNDGLLAQMLHRLLHQGGDGGLGRAAGGRHGGRVKDGVVSKGGSHHLLHRLFQQIAEPRRDVGGGASQVRGVGHGGDDEDGGVIVHPLVDGGQVVARRHLLRVPFYLVPQSHHIL